MSFPKYPEYKDSGEAGLGCVPVHWSVQPLKAVSSCNDQVLDEKTEPDEEILYVDISSVSAASGITSKVPMRFKDAPSRARRRVQDGDVIVSTVRTYLKAIAAIHDPEPNLVVSTGFAVVRPRVELWHRFLGYLLTAGFFIDEVISRSTGVSYPAINASDLVRIKIPIPPKPEQRLIAAFLSRETVKIDALIGEQQRLIALLSEKRQAVISHAVTKGLSPDVPMKDSGVEWLGEVPAHWEVTRVGNLFIEVSESGETDLPVLSVSIHHGVSDRELGEQELDRKVSRSEDRTKYKRVRPGDLVYNMMRAWQGAFGAVAVDGMVSPAYVVARPRQRVSTFVELLLRTPKAIEEMRRFSNGVTDFRLRLYWPEFKNIRITLPPPQEMEAICDYANRVSAEFSALIEASNESVMLLNERRTALISAAVTGKIDVRGLADIKTTSPEARDVEPA